MRAPDGRDRDRRRSRHTAPRDLVVVLAVTVGSYMAAVRLNLAEGLQNWLERHEAHQYDELTIALLVLVLGLTLFSLLRWNERRRESAARSTIESRYQQLVERVPAVTYVWDSSFAVGEATAQYVSPQIERILGFSVDEWQASPDVWNQQIHPDDHDRVLEEWDRALHAGDAFGSEYRIFAKDGHLVWIRDEAVPVADGAGGRPVLQGVMFDITARRQAEDRLRETEARYRNLVERIPTITYMEEIDSSHLLYVSPQIERILGYSPEEYTHPELWRERVHPDDLDRVLESDRRSDETGQPFFSEYRMFAKDGREVWLQEQTELIRDEVGTPQFWLGVQTDITERKLAEQRLRDAERRYRRLVEQLPAVVYIDAADDLSTALYMSPRYEELLGYTWEERLEQPDLWVRTLHPDDRERVLAESSRTNETGDPFLCEYRLIAKDGRTVWVRDEAHLVEGEAGGPKIWQGVLLNITQQRRAQEQLREAEQLFRVLVEQSPAMLYIETLDASSSSQYISPRVEDVYGVTAEDYMADPQLWYRLLHPDDRERTAAEYEAALAAGNPWSLEYRVVRPDGKVLWVRDECSLLRDETGAATQVQGVVYDITARKLAEQTLRESEQREREAADQLRALDDMKNTFLAAVSHELRSPLTSILGLSLTLERQDKISDDDRDDLLGRLAQNARKLDRLLKDLLDIDRLSRGIVTPQYRLTDVGALVRRTIESLDTIGGHSIMVQTEPVLIPVEAAKVERIVENLVANAVRHTSEGSTIWVKVGPQDGGAIIVVEDDGPGVPPELRRIIFEPFRQGPNAFTANPGTGIGLSLVARFAELHGGRAWVDDRRDGGAVFSVFLPGSPEPVPYEEPAAGTGAA